MGNHPEALEYLLAAVEVAQENEHKHAQASAFVYLGKLYQDMGNHEKALDSYREGLKTAQQIGLRIFESEALTELGELFGERKDYAQAVESLSKALGIAREMGNSEQTFRIHHLLSQSYEQHGDYALALNHYKAFYTFRQKVFGEESDKNLKRVMIQAEVENAQREAEIHRLKHVELAARVQELEEALAQIRQLQSLLPICSYCKSIRDDKNYWQSVESYIGENTGTQFSHSICPPCYEKVVQPQLDEMRQRKSRNLG
jgi:tetratricopeptide (TPR) repeat protein